MTRIASWGMLLTVALILAGALGWVAGIRFGTPPIEPPRPSPNYVVQAEWSLGTIPVIIAVAIVVGVIAARRAKNRGGLVLFGCCTMTLTTILGAVLAFSMS